MRKTIIAIALILTASVAFSQAKPAAKDSAVYYLLGQASNCKWSTVMEQNRNTRSNIYITINGITKILKDWSKYYGVNSVTVGLRYKKGIRGELLFSRNKINKKTMVSI